MFRALLIVVQHTIYRLLQLVDRGTVTRPTLFLAKNSRCRGKEIANRANFAEFADMDRHREYD